jgi:hypothetical protein
MIRMEDQEFKKKKMEKNAVSVLGASEVWCKGQSEIKCGDYTVHCSKGERAERGTAIMLHRKHSAMCCSADRA